MFRTLAAHSKAAGHACCHSSCPNLPARLPHRMLNFVSQHLREGPWAVGSSHVKETGECQMRFQS